MQTYVYKSLRKDDTYLFLAKRDDFTRIPAPVLERLGRLQFVLELALTPERRLARGTAADVMAQLAARGFYLQMASELPLDPMTEDWGTDA
ncbi:YcgL domain-containing protein [Montanilutibacter psychrotolerans]|uniref:YcgL domain-containing protein EER27_14495 n=1 Tax=Montanilutibacter psychrotolerans TaxID=1327343 RepID=A0A3M8SLX5_9GAMM|nr:YcgL domain-containing protein [Lysobacter psychrotolerans]RNF82358.1 YcgL domain-containing protein [Lysobacter psychrotolerans]